MKTETHTPGPWTWVENHPKNACVLILANVEWGECNIATLHCAPSDDAKQDENGVWGDHPERRANARLISAAPDLLEALEACLASLERADTAEGVCCCGDSMDAHSNPMNCGHSPVDMGQYYAGNAISAARAAIAKATGDA